MRKWFDLLMLHKEDLAQLITFECVSIVWLQRMCESMRNLPGDNVTDCGVASKDNTPPRRLEPSDSKMSNWFARSDILTLTPERTAQLLKLAC